MDSYPLESKALVEMVAQGRLGRENGVTMEKKLGTVRIAPGVLATIVGLTTLAVPGVAGMSDSSGRVARILGRGGSTEGVKIHVKNGCVLADVHIVVEKDVNMLKVGRAVQEQIAEAINNMVGMPIEEINIYIQDVEQ